MDVKVRVRLNRVTGEVELFDVVDVGLQQMPIAQHNTTHDRIASDLGRVFERNPEIEELPAPPPRLREPEREPEPAETTTTPTDPVRETSAS